MKHLLLSLLVMVMTIQAQAQKDKISYNKDSGAIEVNGESHAQLIKENAPGQLGINKNFIITNLDGEELIYMVFTQQDIYDARGQKTKTESYYVINFLESGKSSRKNGTLSGSGAAKLVVKNKLIINGEISPAAEKKFHLKY